MSGFFADLSHVSSLTPIIVHLASRIPHRTLRAFALMGMLVLAGCSSDFEPNLNGWKATTIPRTRLVMVIDSLETIIHLPDPKGVRYRFPQWTQAKDRLLIMQMSETESCEEYRIVAIDTAGSILDTVYIAPPKTALNYSLAPNDSILLLKTYYDDCNTTREFRYSFYDLHRKKALPDTIPVSNSRGILLSEAVWSPDSKKVILSTWGRNDVIGFVYDLTTRDTTYIDEGANFLWSPSDQNLVAYIKDYSIVMLNLQTGAKEIVYEGKRKHAVTAFRWNPTGEFLMINVMRYWLNIVSGPTGNPIILYLNLKDRTTSKSYFSDQRVDTWK